MFTFSNKFNIICIFSFKPDKDSIPEVVPCVTHSRELSCFPIAWRAAVWCKSPSLPLPLPLNSSNNSELLLFSPKADDLNPWTFHWLITKDSYCFMLQYELLNLLLFFIQSGVHFFDSRSSVYLSLCISLSLSLSLSLCISITVFHSCLY